MTMLKISKGIPEGHHTVTPYLIVSDGKKAVKFYKEAFGAQEMVCHEENEKIMHAELKIGNSMVMIADEFPPPTGCGMKTPLSLKGTPVMLHLYVEDVDISFNRAIKAGAKSVMPVADMFWGDRYGQVEDPFGHRWSIATAKTSPVAPQEKQCPPKSSCCHHH